MPPQGISGLDGAAAAKIAAAEIIIGSDKNIREIAPIEHQAKLLNWPKPFLDIVLILEKYRSKAVVILATGDPMWYGAAATLYRYFNPDEINVTPHVSGLQWAANRMGWVMQSIETVSIHGRPAEGVIKCLAPKARILIIANDGESPNEIAKILVAKGYGKAIITALSHIGSDGETRHQAIANDWQDKNYSVPNFHIIAVECPENIVGFLPLVPGLDDGAYLSDGNFTKAETRAITLAELRPFAGAVLWDIGSGSGSIGIEWMRSARESIAYGIDCRQDRLDMAQRNAINLGAPEWKPVLAKLPKGLDNLPLPDAIFIGGGLDENLINDLCHSIKDGGRLVANAVTIESEAILATAAKKYGGTLKRIAISRSEAIGNKRAWRALMPVTQWAATIEKESS